MSLNEETAGINCSPVVSSPQQQRTDASPAPLSATPKRRRIVPASESNVRQEPSRTWREDPLSEGFASGFGAMHRKRRLTDIEWTKVLASDQEYNRLQSKTPDEWEQLMGRLRVSQASNYCRKSCI